MSWTKRAETRLCAMTTAFASDGISTPLSTCIVTRTRSSRGSMSLMRPTDTPSTRTSSPSYRPLVEANSAWMVRLPRSGRTNTARAPSTSTTTAPMIAAISQAGRRRVVATVSVLIRRPS
ncbi:hypothetical protein NJ76_08830 [Rhodococcus sp. IITR03]|nr:hypothetical protein NJ76_08830 [Rhodococcus sp. IITR03]